MKCSCSTNVVDFERQADVPNFFTIEIKHFETATGLPESKRSVERSIRINYLIAAQVI